jgi:transposase
MLNLDQFMNIRFLHKQGHSVREIARLTGHARNTVRKLLRATLTPVAASRVRASKLDIYKPYLTQRWQAHGLSAVRLWPEIRAQGFTGSIPIVRRFLHTLKAARHTDQSLTVRFETPPGEQAQCDWAEVGRYPQPDGTSVRAYAFVMVLGYSRYLYVEFTRSMTLPTLIRCHQNAFAFFGGWPRRILYDNMRQVVVGPERINARFLDFTRHHGFEVKRCRPYRPRTKGKVERSISYLRDSFLNGRTFTGLDDLNAQGRHWLGSVANIRIHGTTHARPCDRLLEETLTPCSGVPRRAVSGGIRHDKSGGRHEDSDGVARSVTWLGSEAARLVALIAAFLKTATTGGRQIFHAVHGVSGSDGAWRRAVRCVARRAGRPRRSAPRPALGRARCGCA